MNLRSKKKKLLVIFASPTPAGTTRAMLDNFLNPFRETEAWEITEINAYELHAQACTGCKACAKKERCRFDDLDTFDKQLRECDLFVVASPVYNYSFPAPFKAVLDRFQRYFEARFSLGVKPAIKKHREAALLLTMGSGDERGIEITTYQLERAFSVMNTDLTGCAVWSSTDLGNEKKGESLRKAHTLALEFLNKL